MIPKTAASSYMDPADLLGAAKLSTARSVAEASQFPMRLPKAYAAKIDPTNAKDPLLLQVLPTNAELLDVPGFGTNPVGDMESMAIPGLLHKYQGRALLITTGACAIHCRYCFRRHFPYNEAHAAIDRWQPALEYLQTSWDIHEIILSGGDPLSLSNSKLLALIDQLEAIEQLKTLRIHTRHPIVMPERVDKILTNRLGQSRFNVVIVVHANHPNEIADDVATAIKQFRDRGIHVLNQSVLLKDINDNAEILIKLSHKLFDIGVMPYYLHMLDPVAGAAHFDIPKDKALALMESMRAQLPGYLVPRLVKEIAGHTSKTPITTL